MSNWLTLEFFRTDPGIAVLLAGVVLWTLLPVVVLFRVDRRLRKLADELGSTRQVLTDLNGQMIGNRRVVSDTARRSTDRFESVSDRVTAVNRDQQTARKAGVR